MRVTIPVTLVAVLLLGVAGSHEIARADERSDAIRFCNEYKRETGVNCSAQRCPCGRSTTEVERWDRGGLFISQCACVSKKGLQEYENRQSVPECRAASDCDDGIYCNGTEQCRAGACAPGPKPCPDGRCDETTKQCEARCEDRDGDGYAAMSCGGTDCDDNDNRRSPGLEEVCDERGIDEDCDATTVGDLDRDNDGFVSWMCR